jgi:hypothetical protein
VLKRGVPLLLDATVEAEEFGLRFDALQRASGSSRLGNFHYVPVVFHEAEMPARKPSSFPKFVHLARQANPFNKEREFLHPQP